MRAWGNGRTLLLVGLVVAGALIWLLREELHDDPVALPAPSPASERVHEVAARPSFAPGPREATRDRSETTVIFDPTVQHTADPCSTLREPAIPASYEQISAQGVTVAWSTEGLQPGPADAPFRPVALAHLTSGLLEEAAALTGTDRRTQLTVIIDPSQEDMQARTKAPAWASGLYDGGAVRLALRPGDDLAVALSTLRHEVMHAQLHASVGCMPFWFNEGLAMYFAGTPPLRDWLAMLRTGESLDVGQVAQPSIRELTADGARKAYALSLAMLLYISERGGEPALRAAVRTAQTARTQQDALDLWERSVPGVRYRAVLDALATKLLGLPPGAELEAALAGPLCCAGLRSASELACRAATTRADNFWTEMIGTRRAACRQRW